MFPGKSIPRFVTRLGASVEPDEQLRVERILASGRVFLACAALVAISLDSTEPARYANVAYTLLIGYAIYSFAVVGLMNRASTVADKVPWIHALDLLVPAVITLFTEGPNSAFFLFFVFVLTAAAFRWGLMETFGTSVAVVTIIIVEAAVLSVGHPIGSWVEGEYEVNRLVIRASYLILLGILLGFLAEEDKQLRAEARFISRVAGLARVESGMRGTLQGILGEIMRLYRAPRSVAILKQSGSGRVFLWHCEAATAGRASIGFSEVSPEERGRYAGLLPADGLYCQRGSEWKTWAIAADGKRVRTAEDWTPAALPEIGGAKSVLAVTVNIGEEWSGYLLLPDAQTGRNKPTEIHFASKLFRQIAPAIYSVYLLRRLRSRAGAVERARVARELHDGAIQALIAVEMEVDVLRRQTSRQNLAQVTPPLEHIQGLLREQVMNLRTLMQQMRPVELTSAQFLDHLAESVERFRRDTGITAEFTSALEEADLTPRACRELLRIAQEALTNIRKHSGAHHVLVRFGVNEGHWKLSVEDDGRGFDFTGRHSLVELEARRKGPGTIKERVRMLGGNLEIESTPGQGSRLEITLPQKAQASYV